MSRFHKWIQLRVPIDSRFPPIGTPKIDLSTHSLKPCKINCTFPERWTDKGIRKQRKSAHFARNVLPNFSLTIFGSRMAYFWLITATGRRQSKYMFNWRRATSIHFPYLQAGRKEKEKKGIISARSDIVILRGIIPPFAAADWSGTSSNQQKKDQQWISRPKKAYNYFSFIFHSFLAQVLRKKIQVSLSLFDLLHARRINLMQKYPNSPPSPSSSFPIISSFGAPPSFVFPNEPWVYFVSLSSFVTPAWEEEFPRVFFPPPRP